MCEYLDDLCNLSAAAFNETYVVSEILDCEEIQNNWIDKPNSFGICDANYLKICLFFHLYVFDQIFPVNYGSFFVELFFHYSEIINIWFSRSMKNILSFSIFTHKKQGFLYFHAIIDIMINYLITNIDLNNLFGYFVMIFLKRLYLTFVNINEKDDELGSYLREHVSEISNFLPSWHSYGLIEYSLWAKFVLRNFDWLSQQLLKR